RPSVATRGSGGRDSAALFTLPGGTVTPPERPSRGDRGNGKGSPDRGSDKASDKGSDKGTETTSTSDKGSEKTSDKAADKGSEKPNPSRKGGRGDGSKGDGYKGDKKKPCPLLDAITESLPAGSPRRAACVFGDRIALIGDHCRRAAKPQAASNKPQAAR